MVKSKHIMVMVLCLVASVSALLLMTHPVILSAFAAPSTCNELQIIFLVDQSGSMRGNSDHPVVNDPLDLRFYGPKHAIERIGPLRYTQHPTMTIRFALVNFGTTSEIGVGWTSITPTNELEWNRQWATLGQTLAPGKWASADMGNTNFVSAFDKAAELFNQLPQQIGDCPKRAVIVLTDGRPQIPQQVEPGFSVASHFAKLQKLVDTNFPRSAYNIFVIAMSQDAFWDDTEKYWLTIAGNEKKDNIKTGLVKNDKEIGQRFADIIQMLIPTPGGRCVDPNRGTIVVPPYLQQVSFTLYKATSQPNHLRIEDDHGVIDPARTDIRTVLDGFNGPIETVRVINPLPGVWRIKSNLPVDKCDIQMLPIPARGKLLAPIANSGSLDQFSRFDIAFQITDSDGNALPDYGLSYPLLLKASVNDVAGIDDLNALPDSKNKFTAPYIPVEPGAHTVDLLATSQDAEGKTIEIVRQQIGTFNINPVKLVMLDSPAPGSVIQQYASISTTLALVGANNKPITVTLPANITANVFVGDKSQPVTITAGNDGTWTGAFTVQQPGSHRLKYEGSVTLSDGTKRELGSGEIPFTVSLATLLRPQVLRPMQKVFEGTNFLGQPNGFVFEVQIVDATGKPVDPTQVVEGNIDQVFKLAVSDSSRKDRSAELVLQHTAQPGVYRAEAKNFGADDYTIRVLPVAPLKREYIWGDKSWVYDYKGTLNLGVIGVLAILGMIVLDFGQCVARNLASRANPFRRGTLVIARRQVADDDSGAPQNDDAESFKQIWTGTLPSQFNYARFLNGWAWRCIIPWHYRDLDKKLNIRKIQVRNLETKQMRGNRIGGQVRVTVVYLTKRGVASKDFKLSRGGLESRVELPVLNFVMYLRDPMAIDD